MGDDICFSSWGSFCWELSTGTPRGCSSAGSFTLCQSPALLSPSQEGSMATAAALNPSATTGQSFIS